MTTTAVRRAQLRIARDRGDRCAELILSARPVTCSTADCARAARPDSRLCAGCFARLVNGHVQRPERRALVRFGR